MVWLPATGQALLRLRLHPRRLLRPRLRLRHKVSRVVPQQRDYVICNRIIKSLFSFSVSGLVSRNTTTVGNLGAWCTHTHTHSRQIVADTHRAIEGTTADGNAKDDDDNDNDCSRFASTICIRCDTIEQVRSFHRLIACTTHVYGSYKARESHKDGKITENLNRKGRIVLELFSKYFEYLLNTNQKFNFAGNECIYE